MPRRRRIWQGRPSGKTPGATGGASQEAGDEPEWTLVRDLTHALIRAERGQEAFQFGLDRSAPVLGASFASVFELDGASELLRLVAAHGWPERWRRWLGDMTIRMGFGPSGEAASERRIIEVNDVFRDRGMEDWEEVAEELGFRSLIAVPMATASGVIGVVTYYFVEPGPRTGRIRVLLQTVADLLAAVSEKESLLSRNRHLEAALDEQRSAELVRREEDIG